MPKYKTLDIKDKKVWEDFVLSKKPQSFLQSWNWGEVNRLMGDKIFRLGFYQEKKLVGVCLMIKQTARRGPHLIIPGGPIIDWGKKDLVNYFRGVIREIGAKEGVWFIRVRPELEDSQEAIKLFKNLGFVSAPMHLHAENTWILDITPSEDKILSGMRKNTRYSIRKSLQSKLNIETSVNSKTAKVLYNLQKETAKRHGFVAFPQKLFTEQIHTFGKDNQAKLYLVKKSKDVLVAAIIIFYSDCVYYHHSASSEASRNFPAAYILQWKVIQDAKKMGKKIYNFWGIAPEGVKKHRFSGVTTFKTGFGGKRVNWLHAQDLPLNSKYWLTYSFETIRRIFRGL